MTNAERRKISGNLKTDNNNLRKYLRFFIRLFYKASKIVYKALININSSTEIFSKITRN